MPKVLNKRTDSLTSGAVYVGRPGPYGNWFRIGSDGDRRQVIEQFRVWVYAPEQAELRWTATKELHGHDLMCWCTPQPCHADIWLEIVNGPCPKCGMEGYNGYGHPHQGRSTPPKTLWCTGEAP